MKELHPHYGGTVTGALHFINFGISALHQLRAGVWSDAARRSDAIGLTLLLKETGRNVRRTS